MPSGPPELHEYWCSKSQDGGDFAAIKHLRSRGLTLTDRWEWRKPPEFEFSEEDYRAINYLMWEWDFGGIEDARS